MSAPLIALYSKDVKFGKTNRCSQTTKIGVSEERNAIKKREKEGMKFKRFDALFWDVAQCSSIINVR